MTGLDAITCLITVCCADAGAAQARNQPAVSGEFRGNSLTRRRQLSLLFSENAVNTLTHFQRNGRELSLARDVTSRLTAIEGWPLK